MNKTTLLGFVERQFSTIQDQEIEQKAKALDQLYLTLTGQFPGFFVPKPNRQIRLAQGSSQEKRELLKAYIKRLSEYQYLIQHQAFKQFIEKKIDVKRHIAEPAQVAESSPFEVADRLSEVFGYLMEVPIQDSDYKVIERFDTYIKAKLVELDIMRTEIKAMLAKLQPEHRSEGKLYQKVTYQSFYYQMKMTAECLGIKNKDLMNLSSAPLHQRVISKEAISIGILAKGTDRRGDPLP